MAKLPRSPDLARLAKIEPDCRVIEAGTLLHRVYFRGGDHPTTWSQLRKFGPVSRFDHHQRNSPGAAEDQHRGVLYAANDIPTALADTFQRTRRIDRVRHDPWLAAFRLAASVTLLDLTDLFCIQAGASAKLISGPFRYTQRWSAGFYDAYPQIEGLYYRSSMTSRANVVLYARGVHALPAAPAFHRSLADATWHRALVAAARQIGYGIV